MPPKSVTDPNWSPREGELTWTRIDKSTTRALGMIIRLPPDELARAFNSAQTESVYCDMDGADRYSVACLTRHGDQDSHVYVPRHYMKAFDLKAAVALKCMRTKPKDVRDLTPWDRDKRRSIKVVQRWLENGESLDSVHHFVNCPECCDEASDVFWAAVKLTRGSAHLERKESLDRRRQLIKEECLERDQLLKERQLKAAAHKDEDERNSSTGDESADEGSSSPSGSSSSAGSEERGSSDGDSSSFEEASEAADEDDALLDDEEATPAAAAPAPPKKAGVKRSPTAATTGQRVSKKRRAKVAGSAARKKSFLDSSSSSEGTEAEEGGDCASTETQKRKSKK